MEQWVIHSTVEIAGNVVASGNLADHVWSTIEACKDFIAGTDVDWLKAKAWLEHMAGPNAAISYECISNATKS